MPAEPNSAAVSALGALLTVLTFTSGFVSVRLHGAHREAIREQRELDHLLVDPPQATLALRPAQLERHYREISGALRDALALPAVVFLAAFTGLGVWLVVVTGREAKLRLFDSHAPDSFWALAVITLALGAVTALTCVDFLLLRRRLRQALAASVVHRVLRIEHTMGDALRVKRKALAAQNDRDDDSFRRGGYKATLNEAREAVKQLEAVPDTERDSDWAKGHTEGGKAVAELEAVLRSSEHVERQLAAEQERLRRCLRQFDAELKDAGQILDELDADVGAGRWGRLAGLQAVRTLVRAFQPDMGGWLLLTPEDVAQARSLIETATTQEPDEARWWAARAVVAEHVRDFADASRSVLEAYRRLMASPKRRDGLLVPSFAGAAREGRAYLFPRTVEIYEGAYKILHDEGSLASAEAYLVVLEWLRCAGNQARKRLDAKPLIEAPLKGVEAVVAAMCAESSLGWSSAKDLLKRCGKAAEASVLALYGAENLQARLDAMGEKYVRPSKELWDAKYRPGQTPMDSGAKAMRSHPDVEQ